MDDNDREDLKRALKLAEENNDMLHKLYRSWRWARVMQIAYWVILVGAALGAFYFIQPYLDRARDAFHSLSGQIEELAP